MIQKYQHKDPNSQPKVQIQDERNRFAMSPRAAAGSPLTPVAPPHQLNQM